MRILFLEDEPKDVQLVQASLEDNGIVCDLTLTDTRADFLRFLRQNPFELILADYTLPLFDGISALRIAQEICPDVPFIFVSGTMGEELAIEALKLGATDYVFKTHLSRIGPSVRRALREAGERSQRKRAEKALQRNEAYLAEAQRLSHTGSFGWHVASGKIYWSEETYRIFEVEFRIQPSLGLLLERVHPEDRRLVQKVIDSATEEGKDFDFEDRFLMPDGSVKYLRVVGRPSTHVESRDLEFVGAVTDITERKRAEQEREKLRQLEAELAHTNRVSMLGEMAASLAHEIKQPIAAAITSANSCMEWLAHEPPNLDRAREAAARIDKYGNRAAEIIDRIRSFYRKSPAKRELVDVNGIVQEMLTLMKDEAIRYSIAIRAELAAALPEIIADRVQLQQVFMNLMLNAIEAMKDYGGELTVRSQVEQDGQLLFSVSDTGAGLPTEKMEQIFSAFYTTKPQGSGMGLAISRSIVESHGGRLWATANDERGATFHLTLLAQTSNKAAEYMHEIHEA